MASISLLSFFSIFRITSSVLASFFKNSANCNNNSNFDSYVYFLLMQKSTPYQRQSQQPIISIILSFLSRAWGLLYFFCIYLCAVSISHKVSLDVFWFFYCKRKMSISAKKCASINLSLMGCFGPIDKTSWTHPGSSMLSSTSTDCSFFPKMFILSLGQFL